MPTRKLSCPAGVHPVVGGAARGDRACQRAMAGKAPRQPWQLWQPWQCGICKLQILKGLTEFESHPLRQTHLRRLGPSAPSHAACQ
jgi:hypothetical protein